MWCPKCARKNRKPVIVNNSQKFSIDIAKKIVYSRDSIKSHHTWCPQCSGYSKLNIDIAIDITHCKGDRYSCNLELAKKVANAMGGDCLSEKYINAITPLLWQCNKKHIWYANLDKVKNLNMWCPFCKKYKRERLCYEIISKYLGAPLKIQKPDFLKTPEYPTGLQLDILYYYYGFAIEVQGEQHEKYHKFFHRNQEAFKKQLDRDQLKRELCEENWIVLIEVWYYENPHIIIPERLQELGLIS
ncbi:31028_t:CDS:2 [Racocetra persica]|uniref:31028_t:CDS:1 n=1 Tax=Racocetra persica TaxID=160502 RepID=A0ACA9P8Y6_9GLOM|nr:31028_t:CDS:2 [Racocetra persica]